MGHALECAWFGYLRRDGRISSRAKGTIYKGPFHLPRMFWYCWQRLEQVQSPDNQGAL